MLWDRHPHVLVAGPVRQRVESRAERPEGKTRAQPLSAGRVRGTGGRHHKDLIFNHAALSSYAVTACRDARWRGTTRAYVRAPRRG